LKTFFPQKYGGGEVMTEVVCEPIDTCAKDQVLFKGKLASALAFTSAVAPYTAADILPKLKSSAVAAAKQCSGGANQTLCGRRWYHADWDGTANMQEQVSATSLFASNLVQEREAVGATSATSDNNSAGNETSAAGRNEDSKDNGSRGMGVSSMAIGSWPGGVSTGEMGVDQYTYIGNSSMDRLHRLILGQKVVASAFSSCLGLFLVYI
jgi:mannan endo-1,6-alpha-mannosidase